MKWKWTIEEKLKLKHRCPHCKKVLNEEDIKHDFYKYCQLCGENITGYIYFRLNVKYFGIRKALE